jgi:hypothetical protein
MEPRIYDYQLGAEPKAILQERFADEINLKDRLESFLQVATKSLLENSAGTAAD